MREKRTTVLTVFIILISVLTGFLIGNIYNLQSGDNIVVSKNKYDSLVRINDKFSKLTYLENEINSHYYKSLDDIDLNSAIVKGMFNGLDRHSNYYTKEEFDELKLKSSGKFTGVGIRIMPRESGTIRVVNTIENSPAEAAGIQANDLIYKVDDKLIEEDETHNQSVSRMLGKAGTKVMIYIYRQNNETNRREELKFEITRAEIDVAPVESKMLDDGIGYLNILEFTDSVYLKFKEHLNDLKSQGMKKMILDLRGNPGGSLDQVIKIADEILPSGKIVSVEGRASRKEVFESDERKKLDIEYVVLIDSMSASASEILSGAIQDFKHAKVIGEKSFGKGVVQTVRSLSDGSGFSLTTAYYYTPSGKKISKETPVKPDIDLDYLEKKGYKNTYKKSGLIDNDGVKQFAIDYLLGKVK